MASRNDEGRAERIKALLLQRRQTFGLAPQGGDEAAARKNSHEDATTSPSSSNSATLSKHERIQQLLMQRRMAQHAPGVLLGQTPNAVN